MTHETSRDRPARLVPALHEFTPHETEIDHGARCDDHALEVFPVRCTQCETLRAEFSIWPSLTAPKTCDRLA